VEQFPRGPSRLAGTTSEIVALYVSGSRAPEVKAQVAPRWILGQANAEPAAGLSPLPHMGCGPQITDEPCHRSVQLSPTGQGRVVARQRRGKRNDYDVVSGVQAGA
jgi:hypothetical protein